MKQSRFTDEQIIGFLQQADAGISVKEICRSGGFNQPTLYKWRSGFGGMEPSDAAKLRELEAENNKLKKLLAEAHLTIHDFKIFFFKALSPDAKREAVKKMVEEHQLSERRACNLVGLNRNSYRNPPQPDQLTRDLGERIVDIAHGRRRFGYRRIHDLLRSKFPGMNHKRVYWLYKNVNLAVRAAAKKLSAHQTSVCHFKLHASSTMFEV